jgi:hypothetical protein
LSKAAQSGLKGWDVPFVTFFSETWASCFDGLRVDAVLEKEDRLEGFEEDDFFSDDELLELEDLRSFEREGMVNALYVVVLLNGGIYMVKVVMVD